MSIRGRVRSIPFRQHDSFFTIGRLPDHLEVRMLFVKHFPDRTNCRIILDQQDPPLPIRGGTTLRAVARWCRRQSGEGWIFSRFDS